MHQVFNNAQRAKYLSFDQYAPASLSAAYLFDKKHSSKSSMAAAKHIFLTKHAFKLLILNTVTFQLPRIFTKHLYMITLVYWCTRTQHGPVIIIIHQCANFGQGKFIYTSIQTESYQNHVDNKTKKAFRGTQFTITPDRNIGSIRLVYQIRF
jgi:hypothetical protein